jgi:hypothetical protein
MLSGTTKCQSIIKGCRKTPTFSNRVTREEGDAATIAKTWDDARELKRRIWLDFWDGAFFFSRFCRVCFSRPPWWNDPTLEGRAAATKR